MPQPCICTDTPATIAEELKSSGRTEPRRFEKVLILFADFVGFTQTVGTIPAGRMVEELNDIFAVFDDIVDRHGLKKIKTIGDACMAAAGLPKPADDHALRCVRVALDMQKFIAKRNQHSSVKWGLRVGIHSGPVIAGVVDKRKYAYDIWGDTVNIAAARKAPASQAASIYRPIPTIWYERISIVCIAARSMPRARAKLICTL